MIRIIAIVLAYLLSLSCCIRQDISSYSSEQQETSAMAYTNSTRMLGFLTNSELRDSILAFVDATASHSYGRWGSTYEILIAGGSKLDTICCVHAPSEGWVLLTTRLPATPLAYYREDYLEHHFCISGYDMGTIAQYVSQDIPLCAQQGLPMASIWCRTRGKFIVIAKDLHTLVEVSDF